jgi:hypothetical protein
MILTLMRSKEHILVIDTYMHTYKHYLNDAVILAVFVKSILDIALADDSKMPDNLKCVCM